MTKLILIVGFVLAISTLGFAAANAGAPSAPQQMLVDGHMVDIDYN